MRAYGHTTRYAYIGRASGAIRAAGRSGSAVAGAVLVGSILGAAALVGAMVSPTPAAAAVSLRAWSSTSSVSVDPGKSGTVTVGARTTGSSSGQITVSLTLDLSDMPSGVQISGCGDSQGDTPTCTFSLNSPGPDGVQLQYSVSGSAQSGTSGTLGYSVSEPSGGSANGHVSFRVSSPVTISSALSGAKKGGTTTASATVSGMAYGGFGTTVTIAESDKSGALKPTSGGNGCSAQGHTYTCRMQGTTSVSGAFTVSSCGVLSGGRYTITVLFTVRSGGGFGGGDGGDSGSTLATSTATLHPSGCTIAAPSPRPTPSPSALLGTAGAVPTDSTSAVVAVPLTVSDSAAVINAANAAVSRSATANPVLVGIATIAVIAGIIAVGVVGLRSRRPLLAGGSEVFEDVTQEYTAVERDDVGSDDE